jgi:hypothetical protein
MLMQAMARAIFVFIIVGGFVSEADGGNLEDQLLSLLSQKCARCHGEQKANADVSFHRITSANQLLEDPELLQRILEAIDSNAMPPDGEPPLDENTRTAALTTLKAMLRDATRGETISRSPVRRLNRFQYNNSVRDLFQLNRDVFALPEKLMTRHENYLIRPAESSLAESALAATMPDSVQVASHSLNPTPGLQDVSAFPKDLRAEHGFDNQANQLTLSPLLLDAFLRLSVSIVESPDFNDQSVGIWKTFFEAPAEGTDLHAEIKGRLTQFLRIAFRGQVDDETLGRYTAYANSKMDQGFSFTDSMKKVASAAMSSPMFLYRSGVGDTGGRQFELASNLSYFLWHSCPDDELLRLAETEELSQPEVLNVTIDRMLADPKIERFLDTFPSQWMQLENLLAATPDPQISRYFSLDKDAPASLQMVLEPLLLFDAVFIENRPLVDLIAPRFSYQSEFLNTWYNSELQPPPVNTDRIVEENSRNDEKRKALQAVIETTQSQLENLIAPIRTKLVEAKRTDANEIPPVDLRPYAAWDFSGDLKESVNGLDLTAHGDIQFRNGMVVLNRAYLLSKPLPIDLRAKSLEICCQLQDLDQRGGGLMGIQGQGDFFDTIVIGERQNRHWISGSNGFSRTEDFPESTAETLTQETLHLVMTYADDGTTTLYRNGQPYGKPFQKGAATFPGDQSSVLFGLRHLPPADRKMLSVSIDQARLYDRTLTAEEVAASASGHSLFVSDQELATAMTAEQNAKRNELRASLAQTQAALKEIPPNRDPGRVVEDTHRKFDEEIKAKLRSKTFKRVAAADPRYGGIITNAAMLSMTSGPKRTHPVARGVWVIEVIFNDPPPPPPNNVPPLNEETGAKDLTIREQFAAHRENPSCAGCHTKLDPLGFALENFDITGRWRDKYDNGRDVDSSGTLMRKYDFDSVTQFKESLVKEKRRFAEAFTEHLLRFALARELTPTDTIAVDAILSRTEADEFKLKTLIREVVLSESFHPAN